MPSFTDLSRGDLVEVLWNDAWFDLGEYVEGEFLSSWPRFLLGYFIAIDDGHAVFAMDYSCRDDTFSATASIPEGWITGVRKLGSLGETPVPEAVLPVPVAPPVIVVGSHVSPAILRAFSSGLSGASPPATESDPVTTAYEASSARS